MFVSAHVSAHDIPRNFNLEESLADRNKTTIYDVAEMAGVSRQTVSRVLNNRQDVSDDTRKRVKDVMRELSYHPSAIAQSLSRQKSFTFGVVISGLKYIGPSKTLNGITNKAQELGYGLLLKEIDSADNVRPVFQWFSSHQVDGIIWAVSEIGDNRSWLIDLLPQIDIPIVFLTMGNREKVNFVSVDNYIGAKMATEHLVSLGKKNIGHISGPLEWWEARQRKQGWRDTLIAAGLDASEEHCTYGNWSSASGEPAINQLFESYPEMDAVFVGNDQMAQGVLREALKRGIKIPEELAVIGFDNIPESAYFYPSLSTIFQDLQLSGAQAVQNLTDMIQARLEHKSAKIQPTIILPTLVIRESTVGNI
jgi:DNA-binding LacI/PurR family transcriptional regulator